MNTINSQAMTAPRLRMILLATIGLMIAGGIGAFLFSQQQLSTYATKVNGDNAAAAASNQDVAMLQHLKTEMANNQVAVNRAASIVADSKYYQYQNQIIDDLNKYAKAAGFDSITSFSFTNTSTAGASTSSTAVPTTPGVATPVGLKSVTATVSLPSSISYQSAMNFLKAVESNLTKMDLGGVTMQLDSSTGKLTVNPLTIKVYTQ